MYGELPCVKIRVVHISINIIEMIEGIIVLTTKIGELYRLFLDQFYGTYTRKVLIESLQLLEQLWPYLVVGIITTSALKVFVSREWIAEYFKKNNKLSIIIASLLGVISPLGSYVAIPLCVALFTLGTPLPVIMAFVVSSPLINPNLFFLTAGAFGYELAIVRVISSLVLGIVAGYSTRFFIKNDIIAKINSKKNKEYSSINMFDSSENSIFKIFIIDLYKMTRYVSKYFFIAIVLAALIKIFFPAEGIARLFAKNDFWAVLLSAGAGVPFYVCGGAAIPVVQELADLGMDKGPVLAFFISGPATKVSNLVLMQSAFSWRIFSLYLAVSMVGACVIGLIYNLI